MRPIVLSIAGSDSSAGAGIQADLKAIEANGAYAATVVTAITAQNTRGVSRSVALAPDLVEAQLEAVLSDLRVVAVKTGMLADLEIVRVVARVLRAYGPEHFVLDPVLTSKSGFPLLPEACVGVLMHELFPLASLVTPNVHEASVLSGLEIESLEQAERAGRRLLETGAQAVLIKGGHLSASRATDLLVTPRGVRAFAGEFIDTPHTHGTGCALAAAIAARLALAAPLERAIEEAKAFLTEALRHALPLGAGQGPPDLCYALERDATPPASRRGPRAAGVERNVDADCWVVGAGVIGLAIAWELGRRGLRVVVLERDEPGAGATGAAAGMLAPLSEAEPEQSRLTALGKDSLERYPAFVADLERATGVGCGYLTEGTLWIALTRDQHTELARLKETLGRAGVEIATLAPPEIRRLEPHLSGRAVSGLLVGGDHQVDPRALSRCLARAVRAGGGRIECGMQVEEISAQRGRVTGLRGRTADGAPFDIAAERVVLAAGAWCDRDIRLPGGPTGLRPVKGQLVRLRGARLLERVVRTPDVYLVPRADGELLVGATVEERGFETTPSAGAVLDLLRRGFEALPGLYDLDVVEVAVGLRPAAADHLPLIGPVETEGLFLALGHFRNGVLLAPATAHYLAEWITLGRPAALEPFDPGRLRVRTA